MTAFFPQFFAIRNGEILEKNERRGQCVAKTKNAVVVAGDRIYGLTEPRMEFQTGISAAEQFITGLSAFEKAQLISKLLGELCVKKLGENGTSIAIIDTGGLCGGWPDVSRLS